MGYSRYNNYQKYNKQAVALSYDKALDLAPKVVASGKGVIAEQIIKLANERGIPIKEDEDLVKVLSLLEIDSIIPIEAYAAVAEILSSLYEYNDKLKKKE